MKKTIMNLELHTIQGGFIEKELTYYGDSYDEIAQQITSDENELLYFLETGDDKGNAAFCFSGFMVLKKYIVAARFVEPDI